MKRIFLLSLVTLHFAFSFDVFGQNMRLHKGLDSLHRMKLERLGILETESRQLMSSSETRVTNNDYGSGLAYSWTEQFGGSGDDHCLDMITDEDGNIYITGDFTGQVTFEKVDYVSKGKTDAFIAKFSSNGDFLWFKQLPTTSDGISIGKSIHLDEGGNIYIAGDFSGDLTIGEFVLSDNTTESVFFSKLSSEGEVLLAKRLDSDVVLTAKNIDVDRLGNIYILSQDTGGSTNSVLVKYDSAGNMLKEFSYDDLLLTSFDISGDHIYWAGEVRSPNAFELNSDIFLEGNKDHRESEAFFAKSDLDGNFLWAKTSTSEEHGMSAGSVVVAESDAGVYLAGEYTNSIVWDGNELKSGREFLIKTDANGNFSWITGGSMGLKPKALTVSKTAVYMLCERNGLLTFSTVGELAYFRPYSFLSKSKTAIGVDHSDNPILAGSENGTIYLNKFNKSSDNIWKLILSGNSAKGTVIATVTDTASNIYSLCYTTGAIEFQGEMINQGSFLMKQSSSGDVLWINKYEGIDFNQFSSGNNILSIDQKKGFLYFVRSIDLPLGLPGITLHADAMNISTVILKYDLNGNFIWVIQEKGDAKLQSISIDSEGSIILSARYNSYNGNFEVGTESLESDNSEDGFVAKYNESGEFLWVKRFSGEDTEYSVLVSSDAQNNIYVTGESVSNSLSVDDSPMDLSDGNGNTFLVKLGPDGSVLWKKVLGGATGYAEHYSWPTGIVSDGEGGIYMKGTFGEEVNFDDFFLSNPGQFHNKFISKISSEGKVLWASTIKPEGSNFLIDYNSFDIDDYGSVYMALQTRSVLHFEDTYTYTPAEGALDLIVMKYDPAGTLQWVNSFKGNKGSSGWISSVSVPGSENIVVSGYFDSSLSVGDETRTNTGRHGFISFFGDVGADTITRLSTANSIQVYPNPSSGQLNIRFKRQNADTIDIQFLELDGRILFEQKNIKDRSRLDLTGLRKGLYLLRIKGSSFYTTKKVLIE